MKPKLDEATIKRLVLVKTLLRRGQELSSGGSQVDRMIAVHHFDNSIELLLRTVPAILGKSTGLGKDNPFPRLWTAIETMLKEARNYSLPRREDIFQLHDARNGIQHYGNVPSETDVRKFETYTQDFTWTTLSILGIDFASLSLSLLLSDPELGSVIQSVENLLARKKYSRCVEECFNLYLKVYKDFANLAGELTGTLVPWGLKLLDEKYFEDRYGKAQKETRKPAEDIRSVLLELGPASTMLPFFQGRERELLRFKSTYNKNRHNEKDAEFCVAFVSDIVLKWEDMLVRGQ